MDSSRMFEQFLTWEKGQTCFPDGEIVRVGPSSVVIIPKGTPDHIIKIIKPGHKPRGLSVQDEFGFLQKLHAIKGRNFITPEPVSCGLFPDYLEMVRIPGVSPSRHSAPEQDEKIGKAIGEFAAILFDEFGMIHNDICNGNIICSSQGGPVGIIDIASLQKSTCPEEMFLTPLLYKPNLSPHIAAEFERLTGREIDFSVVCKMDQERRTVLLASHPKVIADQIKVTLDSNLEQWRETYNIHKPSLRSTKSCRKRSAYTADL